MRPISPIIVCGLHRSGTTFVGEILKQAGTMVVHEPLNERYGIEGVPIAYPFAAGKESIYAKLLEDALNYARPWNKEVSFISAKGWKRRLYAVTGGRSGLRWGGLRIIRWLGLPMGRICFKDPFLTLATPYLVREAGLHVVCLVRHPAAIHISTEKQHWNFQIENLLRQQDLIGIYGADIPISQWELARTSHAASIAILWKLMIRINRALAETDDRVLLISHEELCREPAQTAEMICKHLGIRFNSRIESYVKEHSEGTNAEPEDGKTHHFQRNSRALIDVWRNRLTSADETVMREIVEQDVVEYYGKW